MLSILFRCSLSCVLAVSFLPSKAIDGEGSIQSQGITRTFLYHAPGDSIAEGMPLVLVFHGLGESAQLIKEYSGFDANADLNGYIAVYPMATNIGGTTQWNAYVDEVSGHGGIGDFDATDDVLFVDDLIGHFCSTYHIDAIRIYATGFSNGGFMAYRLAVQRPEMFAAVAPISAGLWGEESYLNDYFAQDPEPIGVMQIHGDADAIVPYPDPTNDPFAFVWPLSEFGFHTCESFSYQNIPVISGVEQLVFCDGTAPDTIKVELIRLLEGEHEWPSIAGFDPAATIWSFFSTHGNDPPLFSCAEVGILDPVRPLQRISLYPNPTSGTVHFRSEVEQGSILQVRDMSGRLICTLPIDRPQWDARALSAGIYLLEITGRDGHRQVASLVRE